MMVPSKKKKKICFILNFPDKIPKIVASVKFQMVALALENLYQ